MNNRFSEFKSIEEAKKFYRAELFKVHPDHGGNNEDTIKLNEELEEFLHNFMSGRIKDFKDKMDSEKKAYSKDGLNSFIFGNILKEIFDFNIEIEVIGFWIYCFKSFDYMDKLRDLGFWFSKKHKAWVYSGKKKCNWASKNKLNDNRAKWGSVKIKDQEEQKKIAA